MTRKRALLVATATAAASAWTGPASALVEPSAAGRAPEVRADERDSRVRTVEWAPGAVIRVVGRVGQTLMIRLAHPLEISSFLASDQDVMDGTRRRTSPRASSSGPSRRARRARPRGTRRAP